MIDSKHNFTPTYSKILLTDWGLLSRCMQQQTLWIKETFNVLPPLLTDAQINDAFNGPFQVFFRTHFNASASLTKLESAKFLQENQLFDEPDARLDTTFEIPKTTLDKLEISVIKEKETQLKTITQTHYDAWLSQILEWTATLLSEFKKNTFALTEAEIQDFTVNQPLSELNARFSDLKLAIPKLPKTPFDFQQYFTLKATLALQSVLGRTQKPNADKDIAEALKPLQASLKTIGKTEIALCKTQQAEIDAIMV